MDCIIKTQSVNKINSHFYEHLLALLEPKSGEKKEGGESKSTKDTMKNGKETGSKDPKPENSSIEAKNGVGEKDNKINGKNEKGNQSSESPYPKPKGSQSESKTSSSEEKGEKKENSSEEGKITSLFLLYISTGVWVLGTPSAGRNSHFQLFCSKNAENDYFDQRLEFTAPKHWSKYTTYSIQMLKAVWLGTVCVCACTQA